MDEIFFKLSTKTYGLNANNELSNNIYLISQIVFFIFTFVFTIFVAFLFYLLFAKPQFHKNFNILFVNVFIAYGIETLGRQISLYETFICSNSPNCYLNELMMSKNVIFGEQIKYTGMIAYLISTYYLIAERTWATIYLKRYENKSSTKLMILTIIFQWIVSYSTVYLFINAIIPTMAVVIPAIISMFMLTTIFAIMKKINEKRYHISKTIGNTYTLSERYQLSENMKTAPLITALLKISTILNILIFTIIILLLFTSKIVEKQFIKLLYDLILTIYPFFVSISIIPHTENWKINFAKYFARKNRKASVSIISSKVINNKSGEKNKNKVLILQKAEADIYFAQLVKGWA